MVPRSQDHGWEWVFLQDTRQPVKYHYTEKLTGRDLDPQGGIGSIRGEGTRGASQRMTECMCEETRLSRGQEGLVRLGRTTYAREGAWDTG